MIENAKLGRKAFIVFNYIMLSFAALICLYPLWYTLCLSLSEKAATSAGMVTFYPIGLNWVSYQEIMKDSTFFTAFRISLERVLIGIPVNLIVITMMAYPLSRTSHEFRSRNVLMWIVVFCMLFHCGTIPWYIFMKNYGMIDNIWGLILSGGYPVYYTILMMNFFRNFSKEVEEAAIVDGAGKWRLLFQIVIPCSVPVIATITLFVGVGYWNEYFQGLVLSTTDSHYPLQTYIRQIVVSIPMGTQISQEEMIRLSRLSNKSLDAAKVFITIIPMLVVYPFIQRYFVTGIMIGAVKG